jgi:putative endonuclease
VRSTEVEGAKARETLPSLAGQAARRRLTSMKSYFVYMLRCSDGSFYVGITNNPDYRVAQHNYGIDRTCYTLTRRPVELVHSSEFREVDDAIRWEKQLKRWSRAKKSALIAGDWEAIHRLAKNRSKRAPLCPFDFGAPHLRSG